MVLVVWYRAIRSHTRLADRNTAFLLVWSHVDVRSFVPSFFFVFAKAASLFFLIFLYRDRPSWARSLLSHRTACAFRNSNSKRTKEKREWRKRNKETRDTCVSVRRDLSPRFNTWPCTCTRMYMCMCTCMCMWTLCNVSEYELCRFIMYTKGA
jgi:hypothetical protein